jgi:hypothetical protein
MTWGQPVVLVFKLFGFKMFTESAGRGFCGKINIQIAETNEVNL